MAEIDDWMRVEYIEIDGEMYWAALMPDRCGGWVIEEHEALEVLAKRKPDHRHWMWD